jgi:hypothetical protein
MNNVGVKLGFQPREVARPSRIQMVEDTLEVRLRHACPSTSGKPSQ